MATVSSHTETVAAYLNKSQTKNYPLGRNCRHCISTKMGHIKKIKALVSHACQ